MAKQISSSEKSKSLPKRKGAWAKPTEATDIISAIKEDHKNLKKFIKVLKKESVKKTEKQEAFELFADLLKSHASSEEESLYQPCIDNKDVSFEAKEGFVEHGMATTLLESILHAGDTETWEAEVKVLAESVEHHIQEEEADLLPHVKKAFPKDERMQMGKEFLILRERSQERPSEKNAGVLETRMH